MRRPTSTPRGSSLVSRSTLRFANVVLFFALLLLLPRGGEGALRFFGIRIGGLRRAHLSRLKVLNPLRWLRGDGDALRARIRSLDEELGKLHMDHAILLDRLRHIQSRRAKEYAEQQRMAVGTSQEVKKATDKIRAEAAEQVRRVEAKAAKERAELEERMMASNKKNMEALQAKLESEASARLERAVKKALQEQAAKHNDEISRLLARHKEQLEKAREQLEKVKAAAGLEAKDDMQARIHKAQKDAEERAAREQEKLAAAYEKELAAEKKRTRKLVEKKAKEGQVQLSELEKEWQLKEQDLVDKMKRHQEEMTQLQTELVKYKRSPTSPSATTPPTSNGKRSRSTKATATPGQVPSFNKVNK